MLRMLIFILWRSRLCSLFVVKAFDWRLDAVNYVNFSMTVHDDGDNGNNATVSIHLRVIDRNNMRPEIIYPLSNAKFLVIETNASEAEVLPRWLFNVTAEDLDSEEFKPLSYRISLINAPSIRDVVTMNNETGEVFLIKNVDREEPGFDQEFPVFLTVIDNANRLTNNLFSETIPITLQIKDINDNLPIFANDTQDTVLLLPRQDIAGFVLPFRLKVSDADAPDQCGFLTYSLSDLGTAPVSLRPDNSLVLTRNISGGLVEFQYNVYDGSKPDCAPGHTVSRKLTIKSLEQANLYQLTIELDDDAPGEAREKSEPAQNVLRNIAAQDGLEFVYYDIEQKIRITRAESQWLLSFSFLNQTTGEAVGSDQITSVLRRNEERLISVGVVGIGGSSGTNTGEQEGLTMAEIGAIVLGVFLGLTLILIIVYAVETRKLKRKLRSYRAAESIEVKRKPGGETDPPLPNYSSSVTKVNPLFSADENPPVPAGRFQDDSLSDVISETGSASSGESENSEDLEAVVARTNRQNLNNRLH